MKNALSKFDPDYCAIMDKIEMKKWDKTERSDWLESENQIKEKPAMSDLAWTKAKDDLYAVFIEKSEGEARTLIGNEHLDGMFSYLKLNVFFTECSGHGISERRSKVMRLSKFKKEEDIFQAVLDLSLIHI